MPSKSLHRSTVVLWFLVLACLTCFARAASPASGAVSPSSATATYTGGPFPNNNQLNQVGGTPPVCAASVAPCDDYALTVSIPSNDGNAYIVTVKAQWPRTDADFDLTVLDSGGKVVGQSATSADPEVVSFGAVPRSTTSYTVRVVPYNVQTGSGGDTYTGTVTLTAVSASPPSPPPVPNPPASPGTPRYQSYTPPAGSGLGQNAGEPSIGVNWKTGKVFFQSDVQTLRVTFYDQLCSAFSKALWENKSPATSVEDSDPILFTDHQTGRTIAGMLLLLTGRNESSYTDDDGETWTPSQGSSITSGIDHETIGGGGPFAAPLTSPLYPNAIYYCSQDIATALCALSLDGGQTYGPAVPIYNLTECTGLHGHVKVDPSGAAYVPNESCGGQQALVFTTDNGATWTISPIPDSSPGSSDPSVGIGKAGTLYFGYQATNGHPMAAVGQRSGTTINWSPSHDVGSYFQIENTAFSTVVAGDDDRAAYAFLGSPAPGDFQDPNYRGVWHLFVAHTFDGGQSWSTVDATPDDPVQRGCIWMQGGANTCRNLLDFNDLTVDAQGRVLGAYADGCIGPCAHAPNTAYGNSYSALATIARQTGGKRLFRQFDPVEPVLPGPAMASARAERRGRAGLLGRARQRRLAHLVLQDLSPRQRLDRARGRGFGLRRRTRLHRYDGVAGRRLLLQRLRRQCAWRDSVLRTCPERGGGDGLAGHRLHASRSARRFRRGGRPGGRSRKPRPRHSLDLRRGTLQRQPARQRGPRILDDGQRATWRRSCPTASGE